jgi:hypothetical protein
MPGIAARSPGPFQLRFPLLALAIRESPQCFSLLPSQYLRISVHFNAPRESRGGTPTGGRPLVGRIGIRIPIRWLVQLTAFRCR